MLQTHSSTRGGRQGKVVVFTALSLAGIIGVVAICLDGGVLLDDNRRAQATTDAAALAAATDLYVNYGTNQGADPQGTAKQSALTTASENGFIDGSNGTTVTVNIPPRSGTFVGQAGYAEVIIQYNQQRSFSNIFGSGAIAVTARSVARGRQSPYSSAGIILLDPTGQNSFNDSGSGLAVTGSASVIIDSNNSAAANLSGSAVLNAANVYITGGSNISGGAQIIGTVTYDSPPVPDPLASLPVPDPTTMTVQSSSALKFSSGTHTLNPGVYDGGITLSSPAQAILNPGIYYLNGGGLTVSGAAGLTGNGVMIYNNPLANSDQINISGSGTLNLTPPTSGVYAGLSLFQNRTSTVPIILSGSSATSIQGTFYAAAALLNVSGSSGIILGSQYISYDLTVSGGATFQVDRGNGNVARKRDIRLVE